jgi:hypothetical protein
MQNGIFILEGDDTYKTYTGVKESTNTISSVFSVYPNPANNQLNCILANQLSNTIQFTITDMLGKTIKEESWTINRLLYKKQFDVNDLSDGCYFITVKGDNIHETKKIIIQK